MAPRRAASHQDTADAGLMSALAALVRAVGYPTPGTSLTQYMGDGVLVYFGYPRAHPGVAA